MIRHCLGFSCVWLCLALLASTAPAQTFTVQVGSSPVSLVNHGDTWHYHKGTNAPGGGWQVSADASLDPLLWATGGGGIGYSTDTPNEVTLCQTILGDMINNYTTLYLRRSFVITDAPDPALHLRLTMDYDDGFVAYLDGVEVARSPNAPGAAGVEPASTATTGGNNHESSRGTGTPLAATNIDLGPVAGRLPPGTHVLAILGLNGAIGSSDLIMVPDLSIVPATTGVVAGPLLAVVNGASASLSGVNTFPGSTRVTVNGADATFNAGTGAWSRSHPLAPGANSLNIEAVNAAGATLFSTNQIVVSETVTNYLTSLGASTVLDPSMGVLRVTNSLTVPADGSLTINPGTVLLLGPGINLRAMSNASLTINGTVEKPVGLFTSDGTTMWGELAADGANSHLTVRHVETIGGAVKGRNGATCLLENSYFHNYVNETTPTIPIAGCTSAESMTVRGCHFRVYHETLWQNTLMMVEDSLFELANRPSSDALDFDGALVGSEIRRCTFRDGPQGNTDAIDIGPTTSGSGSTNTFIHDNLMFDFPNDKGVSIGEGSYGIIVSNCLMYGNDSGVAVKDSPNGKPPCTANILNCTIVDCDYGYRCYNKSAPASLTDGGQITNSYNNILWGSRIATFEILNAGIVIADHSDFGLTNWPGTGNFDANPLFVNAAQRDYRLAANSPCIGTGRDGATLGAKFPVGSPLAPSHPYFSSITVSNGVAKLGFWVDSEKNYTVQATDLAVGGSWTKLTNVYHQMRPRYVEVTHSLESGNRFFRLVTPAQP